jgi:endoglucanase
MKLLFRQPATWWPNGICRLIWLLRPEYPQATMSAKIEIATRVAQRRKAGIGALGLLLLARACAAAEDPNASAINQLIGRGINIGNALEAPAEGEWGVTLKAEYFEVIKRAGFNSVRIPVCWSAHAREEKPFTVDRIFLERMDRVVSQALARGGIVILPMHHYNELYQNPAGHKERFLAIWKQVADRYREYPFRLVFEPLNEPHDNLKSAEWNTLLKEVLAVVRQSNPNRTIVIGPVNYNDVHELNALELPAADRNIIVSFHYYLPYEFTHQGAHWAPESKAWLGRKWLGTGPEKQAIEDDFKAAAAWAKKNDRPILLGEFGANSKADMASRVRWTKFVADAAIAQGFSFAYWDFCAEFFGLYDPQTKSWRKPLLESVIPPPASLPVR